MALSICTKAIYQSCDVFFYTLAEKLGIDRIVEVRDHAWDSARRPESILPEEASGVMPSEEWKIRNFKQKWYAGETISVGIGQGAVATTPVQLMRAISAISMDGRMVVPHVASPTGLPSEYLETHHYTDVKHDPDRSGRIQRHHGRDGARSVAGGHRAVGARSRELISLERPDRRRSCPWRFAPSTRTTKLSIRTAGSWDSRRAAIRTSWLRAVRRRRARQAGGATGYPGHQGIRGQATPPADEGGEVPEDVDVGAVWNARLRGRRRTQRRTLRFGSTEERVRRWRAGRAGDRSSRRHSAKVERRNQSSNGGKCRQRPRTNDDFLTTEADD